MFAAALDPNEMVEVDRALLPKDSPLAELDEATVDLTAEPNPPKVEEGAFSEEFGGGPNNELDIGGKPVFAEDCSLQARQISDSTNK